ncbi:MAG: amino acid ABC transporter permease [Oscillospiraceae bacterium]|nr:amino acid ABC transporter permease [Oscillospiraceae bacterium]
MLWTVTLTLAEGFLTTLEIFILTLVFALPLGLVVAFGLMNKWAPLKRVRVLPRAIRSFAPISAICKFVVWIFRGTPLMLQMIIVFYGPGLWFDANPWNAMENERVIATVVAFALNYACYFAVIYQGGIEGVPKGQQEAGQVLGMTKWQIFKEITLLQMIKRILPPMSNEIITLVKDTSLARMISAYELTQAGFAFMKSAGITWPLFYTGVFYLLFNGLLTIFFGWLERKLDYFR